MAYQYPAQPVYVSAPPPGYVVGVSSAPASYHPQVVYHAPPPPPPPMVVYQDPCHKPAPQICHDTRGCATYAYPTVQPVYVDRGHYHAPQHHHHVEVDWSLRGMAKSAKHAGKSFEKDMKHTKKDLKKTGKDFKKAGKHFKKGIKKVF